jgi:hypothetical protein
LLTYIIDDLFHKLHNVLSVVFLDHRLKS